MSDMDDVPLLHVYPQGAWHDLVQIVGNPRGLRRLQAAIEVALQEQDAVSTQAFTADGEGYPIEVKIVSSADMEGQPLPYVCEIANPRATI